MKAIIDGDLILYMACHAVETRMYIAYDEDGNPVSCSPRKKELEDYSSIKYTTMVDEDGARDGSIIIADTIDGIIKATKCDEHTVYLTGSGNYRQDIYPEYKSHRPEKPILHSVLTDYMLSMGAVMVTGQEADDALGIAQGDDTILCSYDKDLRMVEGRHYDFRKKVFFDVSEEEGTYNFYVQLLTGDRTDNIPGIKGVGPKKAEKILDECKTEKEMYSAVQDAYLEKEEGNPFDVFDMITRNARLLWIRREEGELWSPPV